LKQLPEVRTFIESDFEANYVNTKFVSVPHKSPEMIFHNESGEELERLDITKMTRDELNREFEQTLL
jgi:hypothetical protein